MNSVREGRVWVSGVVEGYTELWIPEMGRRRVEAGSWFVLSDYGAGTVMRRSGCFVGFEVEVTLEQLLGGVEEGSVLKRSCLGCSLRDAAYFATGRLTGRGLELMRQLSGAETGGVVGYWRRESAKAEWIGMILDQIEHRGARGACGCCSGADRDTIEAVAEALRENLSETPTIRGLARRFFINECKLKELFRKQTGRTIHGYLREQRMRYARRLLEGGGDSVIAVAHEVGYSNASHFARAFRAEHGINPHEIRRRNQVGRASGAGMEVMAPLPFGGDSDGEGAGLSWTI